MCMKSQALLIWPPPVKTETGPPKKSRLKIKIKTFRLRETWHVSDIL